MGVAVKIPSRNRWLAPIKIWEFIRLAAQLVTRISARTATGMTSHAGNWLGTVLGSGIDDRVARRIGMGLVDWIRTWNQMRYNNRIIISCA